VLTQFSGTKRTWPDCTASMAFARCFAGFVRLAHGDEPLVGQHGLDDLAGAGAARHHQLVLLGLDQQALRLQVGHDGLAGGKAPRSHAVFLGACGVVDACAVQRQITVIIGSPWRWPTA
jgi:hypothetical protein